jgi:hypothetical protein
VSGFQPELENGIAMTPQVRRELQALSRYARAIAATTPQPSTQTNAVDAGRCYIGGALTTLQHLQLLSDEEYREWWGRLMAQHPQTRRIGS